jgi:uncharacterized LabA/DUF88 family protein
MATYTYVDNSNLFIEGQRVAAVNAGMALSIWDAMDRKIFDFTWNVDYGKLYEFVCGQKEEIGCAKLWGSPPPHDSFWEMVKKKGFKVVTYEKSPSGKEKKVDVAIAHQVTKDAYTLIDRKKDEIILVAGDKDFVPVLSTLKEDGFNTCVVFWDHAAKELRESASSFISLNKWHKHLASGHNVRKK